MDDCDLMYLPAHKQRQMIVDKEISALELARAALRRIEALDSQLNAFITVDEEGAIGAAIAADAALASGADPGPLHGVPVAVKDLETTNGLKTTLGSEIYKEWVPDFDSVVVERVRAAGGIILGKTNTPEFGNREETFTKIFPACNNPWDVRNMPGGSSGGSAASIAAGICAIATGTDGGGSVRLPASFCGIFGHKPTQGRLPRWGGVSRPAYNVAATAGPMTNDVRDSAIIMQALCGYDSRDPGSLRSPVPDYLSMLEAGVDGMRIGVSMDLGFAAVDDEVAASVEEAARSFEELGAKVEHLDLKMDPLPRSYWWTVWTANQKAMYGHLADERPGDLMPYTLDMIRHGESVSGADYSQALRHAEVLRVQLASLFADYDILLTPTAAVTAWPHQAPPKHIGAAANSDDYAGISYGAIPFTLVFNISWNPAASIPCGFDSRGMPVGLQVVGGMDNDATVLRACRAFEAARPWTGRRPTVS